MTPTAEKFEKRFTYAEYLTWHDNQRWELIDGVPYNMTPAPRTKHQSVLIKLASRFETFLAGKACVPFMAPTDVVFDEHNVVQPDLLVVCDRNKITELNIRGAPDLVVEILSPSTSLKDRREKRRLYERFGVREYILVDPLNEVIERYSLLDGRYGAQEVFGWQETMSLLVLPELSLNWWEIFEKERVESVNEPGPGYSAQDR